MIELLDNPNDQANEVALSPQNRAALALGSTQTEADLRAMAFKMKAVTAVTNAAGRDECHSLIMTSTRGRTSVSKAGKQAREDATVFSKAVIVEEGRLIAVVEPDETRLRGLRDGWDDMLRAEKEAKEALERGRLLAIAERIANIKGFPVLAAGCRTSAAISGLVGKLAAVDMSGLQEFEDDGVKAHEASMKSVLHLLQEKQDEEAETARLAEVHAAEVAALAVERAELAAAKAEAKRIADEAAAVQAKERAEFEEQRAQWLADQAAAVAEAKFAEAKAEAAELEIAQAKAHEQKQIDDAASLLAFQAAVMPGPVEIVARLEPPTEPECPTSYALILAVGVAFDVSNATAAKWLVQRADEIAALK
jgi:hypothetical protein